MPFNASFSTEQPVGQAAIITFTDTSSGTDGNITERRVYLRKADGTFLVPVGTTTDYIVWDYADSTISIDVLDKDYALSCVVQWLNTGGSVLYDSTVLSGYTLWNSTFSYQLTQRLSGNPTLINDNNFFSEKSTLRENIDSGNQAIDLAADIFAAQQCYDIATEIRVNSQYYFNANS